MHIEEVSMMNDFKEKYNGAEEFDELNEFSNLNLDEEDQSLKQKQSN